MCAENLFVLCLEANSKAHGPLLQVGSAARAVAINGERGLVLWRKEKNKPTVGSPCYHLKEINSSIFIRATP